MKNVQWSAIERRLRSRADNNETFTSLSGRQRKIDGPFISTCRTVNTLVTESGLTLATISFAALSDVLRTSTPPRKSEPGYEQVSDYAVHLKVIQETIHSIVS
ncbi:MAG: hypothetical protein ABGZ53_01080 [Fuerstiella sp.]